MSWLLRAPRRPRATVLALFAALAGSACIPAPLTYDPGTPRPFYCDPTDTEINDGHMDPVFMGIYTEPKGPLSADDCRALETDLKAAMSFVAQFETVADAEAAGWVQAAVWSPGQGVHYVDPARLTGPFDPQRPNWLMFDGTSPDATRTGMMFLVQSALAPPAGFPGDNDHWHRHHELCVRTTGFFFALGENLTDQECAALGGVNMMFPDYWMVHVWMPYYDNWVPTDVFNRVHPSLP